jgi:hypothetical protein
MEGMLVLTQVAGKFQQQDMWKVNTPARIVAIDPAKQDGNIKVLTEGYFSAHSPEISWDGKNMLFTAKQNQTDTWQIYEMNLNNFRISKVTSSPEGCISPVHLPNGRIGYNVLSAKDSLFFGRPVFSCNPDGSDPKQITFIPYTFIPTTVLNDGRVLANDITGSKKKNQNMLMVMRPDGTKAELFYESPVGVKLVGDVSETLNRKLVFVESSLTNQHETNITSITYNRPLHSRVNLTLGIKGEFQSVVALPTGKLLASYRSGETERYGVYEFDPGTKTLGKLVYSNPEFDVCEVKVIHVCTRPKRLPSEVDFGVKTGLLLCQDINFLDPKSAKNQELIKKAVSIEIMGIDSSLGIVPVEKDGSFYIKMIADQPFQLRTLDENGQILNQPCDWMSIRPNERRGCVGCHEDHEQTPENRVPLAVKNLPVNVPVHIEKIKEKKISLE